jgi:hypothetical protein
MVQIRNAFKMLVGKGNLGRSRYTCGDNIKMYLKEQGEDMD